MSRRRSGLPAGALALLVALAIVPAAGATPVTVRIVGDGVALDTTAVETTGAAVGACAGHTAAEAIDKAVAGDWDQMAFTSTILGEEHTYAENDYWNFWINDTYAQTGICDYAVQPGDRLLMFVQRDVAGGPTVFPLTLTGVPASVVAGSSFTVTVNEQRTDGTTTTPAPIAGATVTDGADVTAVTDAAGHATITLPTAGPKTLYAVRRGNVESDSAAVNVVAAMTTTTTTTGPPAGSSPSGPDRSAPASAIVGIAEGQRFAQGAGPRSLRARVAPDPSGLYAVKLRLTRNDRGRCTYFSGKSERFLRNHKNRCSASAGYWFAVGDRGDVDYLLPRRLPRGRYVLDVNAIDKAFNRDDTRRRGANRIVFHVG
jgi:hypothetical protein